MKNKHDIFSLSALVLAFLTFLMAGCKRPSPSPLPIAYEFKTCYLTTYGQFYEGCEQKVVALDLYSEGLTLDSAGIMTGSGTNLFLSDVFVDSQAELLAEGYYHADTTAAAFTYLPGMDFEDNPTGVYRLLVQDSELRQVLLYADSTMHVQYVGDSLDLEFRLYPLRGRALYRAHYRGIPIVKHKERKTTKYIAKPRD